METTLLRLDVSDDSSELLDLIALESLTDQQLAQVGGGGGVYLLG